jgi:TPP-dependent pyruvate/acetoin dehydrogenase alpha subunit
MPGVEVNGSDVTAVCEAAREAIERARADGGPTLIEAKTYRFGGHHEGDPGTDYRTREEVEEWKSRDPIKALREKLLSSEAATSDTIARIDQEVRKWLEDAVQFAKDSPEPIAATVLDHVFCT